MAPAVAVIIPTRNMGRFLGQALESLGSQTFTDWHAVVVDDGSEDDTPQVVERFSHLPVTLLRQQQLGVAAARNRGIEATDSEFIAFLDADDVLLPGSLERRVAALREMPDVGMTYGRALVMDGDSRYRGARGKALARPRRIPSSAAVRQLLTRNTITTSTVMVRRACQERVGRFNEAMQHGGSDWEFFLRVCTQTPLLYIPEALAWYRAHPTNITHTASSSAKALESRLQALDAFFAPDGTGRDFRRYRRLARSAQYLRAGQGALARGERLAGLRCLRDAAALRPSLLLGPDALFSCYLLVRSFVPSQALSAARQARWTLARPRSWEKSS